MATVVLLSCVKSKQPTKSRAEDLYTSTLFRKSLAYARSLKPDCVFILSAKHGVLRLDDEIEPYEQTLNTMGVSSRKAWAEEVLGSLRSMVDLSNDRFVILAGNRYREFLLPHLQHSELPMEGLAFGKQLQWLKERVG